MTSSSAATIATTATSTRLTTVECRPPCVDYVLGPLLSMIPEAGWYKSAGHQLRWLHRISSFPGHDRYGESLSYFYFDGERRRELFTPDMLRGLNGSDPIGVIREPFQHGDGDMLDRMLYADSKIRLPDHPAMITDRMSMAHGLEARSPFMDHRLAEFVARMRSTLKVRGRTLRIVQRRLASRYLPAQIVSRPKQGFASALPYILQNQYRQLYERLLTRSALAEAGILRREPIRALVDSHLAGRADHGHRLWLLINAELWFRMQIQGSAATRSPHAWLRNESLSSAHKPADGNEPCSTTEALTERCCENVN